MNLESATEAQPPQMRLRYIDTSIKASESTLQRCSTDEFFNGIDPPETLGSLVSSRSGLMKRTFQVEGSSPGGVRLRRR